MACCVFEDMQFMHTILSSNNREWVYLLPCIYGIVILKYLTNFFNGPRCFSQVVSFGMMTTYLWHTLSFFSKTHCISCRKPQSELEIHNGYILNDRLKTFKAYGINVSINAIGDIWNVKGSSDGKLVTLASIRRS